MRVAHTSLDPHAVDAALRQLPPRAERLLRVRFGIGRSARCSAAGISALPRRRLQQLEASALRTLRLHAVDTRPS
jgi:DNA-directed RNA polymerase sigma subunit (sigma70/sigma32)